MKEAGIDIYFVQDNQSMPKKGLLRTCTFRSSIRSASLCALCTVFDVAVDLRRSSEAYGMWYGVTLSPESRKQFLILRWVTYRFLVLSDEAEFCYKVNDFGHPNDEDGVAWNNPEIGIECRN